MSSGPGMKPRASFLHVYDPASVMEFVLRLAILDASGHFTTFTKDPLTANEAKWKSQPALHKLLKSADRADVADIEERVNRARSQGDRRRQRWYLTALYDSVSLHRSAADRIESYHTEGELPTRYFAELASAGEARSKPEVLVRAMAMRSYLLGEPSDLLRVATTSPSLEAFSTKTHDDLVQETVNDLLIVACAPPGAGGMEATRLVAEAGTYALDGVRRHVRAGSPVSWRLLRIVSEVLYRVAGPDTERSRAECRQPQALELRATRLLQEVHKTNPPSLYRGRSLVEEAMGALPVGPEHDWVGPALRQRALSGETEADPVADRHSPLPVRERVMAAWTYFMRTATADGWHPTQSVTTLPDHAKQHLTDFAEELREGAEGDIEWDRGLTYAGEFLAGVLAGDPHWFPWADNEVLGGRTEVPNHSEWLGDIREVKVVSAEIEGYLARRSVEPWVAPSLASLCGEATLTIDGVARRTCLTVLQYAHLEHHASPIFASIYESARRLGDDGNWLAEIAVFALGWMGRTDDVDWLVEVATDSDIDDSIRMTALQALGDLADGIRADPLLTETVRTAIYDIRTELPPISEPGPPNDVDYHYPRKVLLRSALYVLSMLRDPRDAGLLGEIVEAPAFEEYTTPALAQWGIDRIHSRQLANAAAAGDDREEEQLAMQLDHQHQSVMAHARLGLRRLVDPLDSLQHARERFPDREFRRGSRG